MVFGPPAPEPWDVATDAQRAAGEINADTCVLPGEDGAETHFFLRGQLALPVVDGIEGSDEFVWSIWVSLSRESMMLQAERWSDPRRVQLPPMFAWVCNHLPYVPSPALLPARIHTREPGRAPSIELDPSVDHPLVREQLGGITMHRVAELNRLAMGG
jgi:hypothetical protein